MGLVALVSAAATVSTSVMAAKAAKKAAKTQADAAVEAGKVQAAAATEAGKLQADAAEKARQNTREMYEKTRADLAPYRELGEKALKTYENLLGLESKDANAKQAALEKTPGYQFTLEQGLQAVQNSYATKGLARSGPAIKAAAKYAADLASQTYQQQVDNYKAAVTKGQEAAATTASFTADAAKEENKATTTKAAAEANAKTTAADVTAKAKTDAAQAKAAGDVAATNAKTSAVNNAFNSLTNALVTQTMTNKASGMYSNPLTSNVNTNQWKLPWS